MTDPRIMAPPDQIRLNEPARVEHSVLDLTRGPGGKRERQLIYGDEVTILNRTDTHCLIRASKDGYCGTVAAGTTGPRIEPTHKVHARSTHAYAEPDIKSADLTVLPFGAALSSRSEAPGFFETEAGFVPKQHLKEVEIFESDLVNVALVFLGTPYLWGGNCYSGIDCSGLVQATCLACGIPCPGDSDQQADELGEPLTEESPIARNDLVFWNSHVALVEDEETFVHATAGFMSVVREPIHKAVARIEQQGDGTPTVRKRINFSI